MARTKPKTVLSEPLLLNHIGVLFLGFLIGILVAAAFLSIPFQFSGELERARELGIVSQTILRGYPQSKDVLTYISVLGFPILFSVGLWFFWARKERREQLRKIFAVVDEDLPKKTSGWTVSLSLIIFIYLLILFNVNYFYQAGYNPYALAWPFLGEEGMFLAWAQSIFSGGVYGSDFFGLFGPMLIYPLVWFMKLFGSNVIVERAYTSFLNLISYVIILLLLYKNLRSRLAFMFAAIFYLLAFSPYYGLSPNTTYLRVGLGLLPLFFTHTYLVEGKSSLLLLSGLAAGQSFLISQEVGLCSAITVVSVLFLRALPKFDWKHFVKENLLFFTAGFLSSAPMLVYLFIKGAIVPFLETVYGYPKVLMLGYAALPFPDFKEFLVSPLSGEGFFYYWVILIYILTSLHLIPLLVLGRMDKRNWLQLSLLIFGVFLYRMALGRSDLGHLHRISPPAFLLVILFAETSVKKIRSAKEYWSKAGNFLLLTGLFISTILLFLNAGILRSRVPLMIRNLLPTKEKITRQTMGVLIANEKCKGIFFDPPTAASITEIESFLEANTKQGEFVYFFPNEAAYYFLFNRNNPTRYAFSYLAVTSEQRRELVSDLEEKRPNYVIYSQKT